MPGQTKIIYAARRHPAIDPASFPSRWQGFVAAAASSGWAAVDRAEPLAVSAAAAESGGLGVEERSAAVGIVWSADGAATLASMADPGGDLRREEEAVFAAPLVSCACPTRERVLHDDGSSGVVLVAFVRRKAGLGRAEFSRYWSERHGPLFLRVAGDVVTRYVQNHASAQPGRRDPGWDGVVEIGFESAGALVAAFSSPDFARLIAPDEEKFLDMQDKEIVIAIKSHRSVNFATLPSIMAWAH